MGWASEPGDHVSVYNVRHERLIIARYLNSPKEAAAVISNLAEVYCAALFDLGPGMTTEVLKTTNVREMSVSRQLS